MWPSSYSGTLLCASRPRDARTDFSQTKPIVNKDQLISKCPFGVFKSPQKVQFLLRISASKKKDKSKK